MYICIMPNNATHCTTLQNTEKHCNAPLHAVTSVLQFSIIRHTATHCNTLQHIATHCKNPQDTATHCSPLQHTTPHCTHYYAPSFLYCNSITFKRAILEGVRTFPTATQCNTLKHTATYCNTLQHTVTHCNTPHHTATHCRAHSPLCRNSKTFRRAIFERVGTFPTATHGNTLQYATTHRNTPQHTATHCKTLFGAPKPFCCNSIVF